MLLHSPKAAKRVILDTRVTNINVLHGEVPSTGKGAKGTRRENKYHTSNTKFYVYYHYRNRNLLTV